MDMLYSPLHTSMFWYPYVDFQLLVSEVLPTNNVHVEGYRTAKSIFMKNTTTVISARAITDLYPFILLKFPWR